MALRRTRWRPDTCACELEYEWDDAVDASIRTHTPRSVSNCETHSAAGTVQQVHAAVLAENQQKNHAIAEVRATLRRLESVEIKFEFDRDRNLRLEVPGVDALERTALTAALTARFAGKVGLK